MIWVGSRNLHPDGTFQFISDTSVHLREWKGSFPWGKFEGQLCQAAGSCIMKFLLSGQGNKRIAYLKMSYKCCLYLVGIRVDSVWTPSGKLWEGVAFWGVTQMWSDVYSAPHQQESPFKGQRWRELGAGCPGCLLAECAWFFPPQINALSLLYVLLRAEGGRLPTSEDNWVEVGGAC